MITTIQVPRGLELVVLGDIHECESQFNKMLERAEVGTNRILVSLGDVYDKGAGPHVAERIIHKIQELSAAGWAYMVRGNHEQRNIMRAKEQDTLTPELEWCSQLPLVLSFMFHNQNRVTVVHGGVTPNHTWGNVSNNTEVMYIRSLDDNDRPIPLVWVDEDGNKKLRASKKGTIWHERYDGRFGYIISGHDSQKDCIPKYYNYSCNIDTRCYSTGVLTGQIVADGAIKGRIQIKN